MQFAQQKKSWRKSLVPPPAVALPPTVVQRQKCCWRNAVRDENKIFVTRSWRQFCGAVSDRTARFYSLDENATVVATAARGAAVRLCHLGIGLRLSWFNFFCLAYIWRGMKGSALRIILCFAWLGIPLPLLREYVRYHIGMIVLSTAHHSSVCLSVLYAEPHFHIESIPPTLISIW